MALKTYFNDARGSARNTDHDVMALFFVVQNKIAVLNIARNQIQFTTAASAALT
jgi:hypothetical protein